MRLIGLTLCLLASSLGARADSVEDRVVALEARVKALEEALHSQADKPAANAISIDGTYKATLSNGEWVTLEFSKGSVTATTGQETKTGAYEIAGQRVIITGDGRTEALTVDGDHLRLEKGLDKIDFLKTK